VASLFNSLFTTLGTLATFFSDSLCCYILATTRLAIVFAMVVKSFFSRKSLSLGGVGGVVAWAFAS
jgi:hypothetical protein